MALLDLALRVGVVIVAVGVAGVSLQWTARHARTALRAARTDMTALETRPAGVVAATGVARPSADQGMLEAPVTGTPCLAYAYRVSRDTFRDGLSDLAPKRKGAEAVPFRLDGATGTALVQPVERDGSGEPTDTWERMQVPGIECPATFDEDVYQILGQEVPERVTEMVPEAIEQKQEVYIREERLEPGTEVYVLGSAAPAPERGDEPVIRNRAGDPFTVTAGGRNATLRRYVLAAAGNAAFGLAAAFVAVVLATPAGTVLPPL
ncbi:hypothetical protein E2L06_00085 [Haloterrigena sp. H1]|uniref:hypothetical protein n=1 Tax=Haloterrigena sp. H1 TaxID=2552943 RepID=UPI00110E2BFB|nr:hypothetical protein [Haloterrigena sp. H1]TMT80209.1 hypothetical protein E2L06_18255 [Haloterrigena sp. H1]TMT85087.1 hypothetical protein E2L06_00085 [Haloterrigena sp. H1]